MARRTAFKLKFKRRKRRSPLAAALAWLVAIPVVALALLTLLSTRFWFADMAANFAWPIAILSLGPFVVAVACRRPVPAVLILLSALTLTARTFIPARAPRGNEADARILVFNAFAETTETQRTLEMLRVTDADVVLLNECNYELALAIQADPDLVQRYPHVELPEHANQWARGVLSVWPLERIEQRDERWQDLRFEYLYRRAQIVRHPTSPFVVGVSTFESPRSPARWAQGHESLLREAALINRYLNSTGLPVVVGLDFNATPTGARSNDFAALTGLVRAKPFAVTAGTWPSSSPAIFRAPIDDLAVDVARGVRVTSWRTIETPTNSDHTPVLVTIDLPDPATDGTTSPAP